MKKLSMILIAALSMASASVMADPTPPSQQSFPLVAGTYTAYDAQGALWAQANVDNNGMMSINGYSVYSYYNPNDCSGGDAVQSCSVPIFWQANEKSGNPPKLLMGVLKYDEAEGAQKTSHFSIETSIENQPDVTLMFLQPS